MKEVAVYINNLSKDFRLPHERRNSLKEHVLSFRRQTFEKFHALNNVDFQVNKGEFFGIVGRNGSGKSTLLKIIGGIYQPTKGSITVNGTLTPFIELGIGFNPELTGRENVFLNGAILGLTKKEMIQKYDEIVAFAEIEKFMDQKLKNYSSGMQVRLAFSIAMQAHNDILLIDEVLAVGDERFQHKCLDIFDAIKKDKSKTIIFVSHDMQTIQQFCDRVVVIHDSHIKYIGAPERAAIEYKKLNFPDMVEAQTDTSDLARKDQRPGSGKVRIAQFEIKDAAGKPDRIVSFGQPFSVEFSYEAQEALEGLVFGFALKNKKGESIYGPNTKESRQKVDLHKGRGKITIHINQNIFAPGSYTIEAGIFNDTQTVCHDYISLKDTITFVGLERHGYVYIKPEWTLTK